MDGLKFLHPDNNESDRGLGDPPEEALDPQLKDMLLGFGNPAHDKGQPQMVTKTVMGTPGLCIKTEAKGGVKVFLNLCHSEDIPSPPSISDEELTVAIATMDNSKYSIPVSLGEGHAELDNAGRGCTAYDVIISSTVYQQLTERQGMLDFVLELCFCLVESRNNTVLLSRNYTVLQRRKQMGQIGSQVIRARKKIQELSEPRVTKAQVSSLGREANVPKYSMVKEPEEGRPAFLVFEVSLPKLKTANTLTLDMSEDQLVLLARPDLYDGALYHLDVDLEFPIQVDGVGAQFNRTTRVLTVTCTVAPDDV